jgi:hypothetical protein
MTPDPTAAALARIAQACDLTAAQYGWTWDSAVNRYRDASGEIVDGGRPGSRQTASTGGTEQSRGTRGSAAPHSAPTAGADWAPVPAQYSSLDPLGAGLAAPSVEGDRM